VFPPPPPLLPSLPSSSFLGQAFAVNMRGHYILLHRFLCPLEPPPDVGRALGSVLAAAPVNASLNLGASTRFGASSRSLGLGGGAGGGGGSGEGDDR
jgi:hypothetical protein